MEDQKATREGHHDMRELNLGPDSKRLVERYRKIDEPFVQDKKDWQAKAKLAHEMAAMLERWMTVAWCWPDNCPATICGGPHVKVRYEDDRMGNQKKPVEVIEPYNKIGTTFPEVPYHVITD
jgi:hypothetical protein